MEQVNFSTLSVPKQTKAFIEYLQEVSEEKESDLFDYKELVSIAKK